MVLGVTSDPFPTLCSRLTRTAVYRSNELQKGVRNLRYGDSHRPRARLLRERCYFEGAQEVRCPAAAQHAKGGESVAHLQAFFVRIDANVDRLGENPLTRACRDLEAVFDSVPRKRKMPDRLAYTPTRADDDRRSAADGRLHDS